LQHSYSDLIKCLYFADTAERGGRAWKEAQRQREDRVTLQIARIENWCWVLVSPRVFDCYCTKLRLLLSSTTPPQLLVAAQRFVRSSPPLPTTALGRRTSRVLSTKRTILSPFTKEYRAQGTNSGISQFLVAARRFVRSSPPLPTTALGRHTTLRSLLSSATTTPPQETSLLPRHSFGISLSLLDYWPSSLVPIV